MRAAVGGLLHGVFAVGLAMAIFLALTVAVNLLLASAATSNGPGGGYAHPIPSYGHVTPDPHP